MKLKALAPAALVLVAGFAVAQDAKDDKYAAQKGAAPAQTQQQSSSKAASPSTAQQGAQSNSQGQAKSQGNATASASATTNVTFATADSNKDGKLSIAEMKIVMPGVTIIDTDSDGYVNQKEAEASITGLTFSTGEDTALITEKSYGTIVASLDDDDDALHVDLDDHEDTDVEIKVEGDVDVKEDN